MERERLILDYFNKFAAKDLNSLEEMFSHDVSLRDWEISSKGIEAVLRSNKGIFDSIDTISVEVLNTYENTQSIACEILIHINNDETLRVVDVITFNSLGKISNIRAYKG